MVVDTSGSIARVTLTSADEVDAVAVAMSRLDDTSTSLRVMSALEEVFEIYKRDYESLAETYGVRAYRGADVVVTSGAAQVTGIKKLRQEVPSLFINNYTRECPILPIMVSQEEADRIRDSKRVIFYPLDDVENGRHYTAPEGYYVGLKRNRLRNRHDFYYLITCYLFDHMKKARFGNLQILQRGR